MSAAMDEVASTLLRTRLVAIVRLRAHENAVVVVETLAAAGVELIEVTVEREEGFDALARVIAAVGERATIGAGTVLSLEHVARVADLGAKFVVTPNTDPAVIRACHERGLLSIPGAFSPSEVALATSSGARFVKLFPAIAGVAYLRALRGPFPTVNFVPTGGVTIENAPSWIDAGAVAVAMGSNLVSASGELDGLSDRATRAVEATRSSRA